MLCVRVYYILYRHVYKTVVYSRIPALYFIQVILILREDSKRERERESEEGEGGSVGGWGWRGWGVGGM